MGASVGEASLPGCSKASARHSGHWDLWHCLGASDVRNRGSTMHTSWRGAGGDGGRLLHARRAPRTGFGTKSPQVQVLSPRPVFPQARAPTPSKWGLRLARVLPHSDRAIFIEVEGRRELLQCESPPDRAHEDRRPDSA